MVVFSFIYLLVAIITAQFSIPAYNNENLKNFNIRNSLPRLLDSYNNTTDNQVLKYLKISLYKWVATNAAYTFPQPVPFAQNTVILSENRLRIYENNNSRNQSRVYLKIDNTTSSSSKTDSDYILDITSIRNDSTFTRNIARLFSVFVTGRNSEKIVLTDFYFDSYRIYIPQLAWSPDLTFIIAYNSDLKTTADPKITNSDNTEDIYNIYFESEIFSSNRNYFSSITFISNTETLTFSNSKNYKINIPVFPLNNIKDKLFKFRSSKKVISDEDLQYIKSSCGCKKLKDNIVKKCCKKKEKKCKIEVTFHRYISYVVTSIKTLCIYKAHSSKSYREECHQLFRKCARKCEDRFEGCNIAMHIMADRSYKFISQFTIVIDRYYSMYIKYNPYLCESYKQGTPIYESNEHNDNLIFPVE